MFKASTGEAYYKQQRLPGPHCLKSSPVAVNGKLYIATDEGEVIVAKMGEKSEVLANEQHGRRYVHRDTGGGRREYVFAGVAIRCTAFVRS